MHIPRRLCLLAALAANSAASQQIAAQPTLVPSSSDRAVRQAQAGPSCEDGIRSLLERAFDIITRTKEHNGFTIDHAEKYKLEVTTCEIARKTNNLSQLKACLALLDRAQLRADKGNQLAEILTKDAESLRAAASGQNQRCPLHQVQVVRQ